LISGPTYALDLLELASQTDHVLELPLHLSGRTEVEPLGTWEQAELEDEFVRDVERFIPGSPEPIVLRSCGAKGARLSAYLTFDGDLLRANGPGAPGTTDLVPFYTARARGRNLRILTVLEASQSDPVVTKVRISGTGIEVNTAGGLERHSATVEGWEIQRAGQLVRLRGARNQPPVFEPLVQSRPLVARGVAVQLAEPPALDGTLDGFDPSEPLELDHEDQYRRSEAPYGGPEEFSARAYVNWSDEGLYLAVEVMKPEFSPRDPAEPPLQLDNEPDEIHSDGIQLYIRVPDGAVYGHVIVPSSEQGNVIVRSVDGTAGRKDQVAGRWAPTGTGYLLTVSVTPDGWSEVRPGDEIGFDLLVNQMLPDRQRRAGQLVWSGGGGWVWLRGDRQDPARFGTLELR
jgi:hypothetical protein